MEEVTSFHKKGEDLGYEIVRELPAQSSRAVLLARKDFSFFVLKWPEERFRAGEEAALRAWQGSAGPRVWFEEDLFVLEFFSGRPPYFWNQEDLPRLQKMFQQMREDQPESHQHLRTLGDHLEKILDHLHRSNLPFAEEAARSLQGISFKEETLIHGDLHPWNIFMRDRAQVIDPYGLRGDPGWDLAFLAASLAHNQTDFLEEMSQRLGLLSAREWFPGLVAYRLDNTLRHNATRQSRILWKLADKIWG